MEIVEEHFSPDGLLRFVVGREDDGDIYLGFPDMGAHTHADILAASSGLPEDAAVRQFVDALLDNRQVVAIMRIDGHVCYVWLTDDPASDLELKGSNEVLEFRYWDGSPAAC